MRAPTRQRALRTTTAHLASTLIMAVDDAEMHWHDIDEAIGARPGTSLRYVMALVCNRTRKLDRAADIVWALGGELRFRVVPVDSPVIPVDETAP